MGRFLYALMLVLAMLAVAVSDTTTLAEPVAPEAELIPPGLPSAGPDSAPTDGAMLLEEEAAPSEPVPLAFAPATDYSAEQDPIRPLDAFWGYRTVEHASSWMVGDGNQFGDFSLGADYHQPSGITSGFGLGLEFHFLAGPEVTDMPPRVFNVSLGYQQRKQVGDYQPAGAVMIRTVSRY